MHNQLYRALKTETDDIHQALHQQRLLRQLLSPALTRAQLSEILSIFHALYEGLELSITVHAPDLYSGPVLDWLTKDQKAFAYARPKLISQPPFEIDTRAKLIGYLYVKNGSMLGGQLISKHLARNLGLTPGQDQHFFSGPGKQSKKRWDEFVAAISRDQQDAAPEHIAEAVHAARETFTRIRAQFDASATAPLEAV